MLIKCPECGIEYETTKLNTEPIQCQDCGAIYLQPVHEVNNFEFVRKAAYRCRMK